MHPRSDSACLASQRAKPLRQGEARRSSVNLGKGECSDEPVACHSEDFPYLCANTRNDYVLKCLRTDPNETH